MSETYIKASSQPVLGAGDDAFLIGYDDSGSGRMPLPDLLARSYAAFNVKHYGAVGDGSNDDTEAIQAAVTAADSRGVIFFPAGTYKITSAIDLASVAGNQSRLLFLGYGARINAVGCTAFDRNPSSQSDTMLNKSCDQF